MKSLNQYQYTCQNAIFNYLKDMNIDNLISEFLRCEKHFKSENNIVDDNINIWFRFAKDDTLVWTVNDIKQVLQKPTQRNNYDLLIDYFKDVITFEQNDYFKDVISVDPKLQIYSS